MKTITGDLIKLALEGEFDVIVHGCNCLCTMDAGIAKAIKSTFPEALAADRSTECGDRSKLGSYSTATVQRNGHTISIINAYTQFHYKGQGILLNYDALRQVFRSLNSEYAGKRVGIPKIGAGLAGGDWNLIQEIIEEETIDLLLTLVIFRR